jgi:peptide/nickel transport system substrate-binding protein
MDEIQRRFDTIRRNSSEVGNHLIDEHAAGRISRREFVRRGSVLGMSLPVLGFIAAACGETSQPNTNGASQGSPKAGGALRTGIISPAGALDPITVADEGGLAILGQSGEYLAWSDSELKLQSRIAESWEPNDDGSVWTFKIRDGVKFHDGKTLTAEDVAATMNLHADPKNGSNALSALGGVLSKDATKALDDTTVEFTLDSPNGNFPYLVSSDNYNVIILPKDYKGGWDKTFIGTGPWELDKYTPDVGVTYKKNPDYWDPDRQPLPDTNEIKFYPEEQARVLALQGGEVDLVSSFSISGGQALLTDPNLTIIESRTSQHRQIHMRTDKEPFKDKRVRQAMALLLDREALIQGLWEGKADLGNDSPFAPVFPSTDTSVPQRDIDVAEAKKLLADAGVSDGFEVELRTWNGFEIPDLAAIVKNAAEKAGITVQLNITDPGSYYGDAVYGKSPWLDSTFGITDYGHRGVPNVLLTAPLTSKGAWNSAHFRNKTYDKLVSDYVAELDLEAQRGISKSIQELLLDEVPIIFPYFYYELAATKSNIAGVDSTGMGHIDVSQAGFTD